MLSSWEHVESHKLFLNLSEFIQILVYFITLCPGGPCIDQPVGQTKCKQSTVISQELRLNLVEEIKRKEVGVKESVFKCKVINNYLGTFERLFDSNS